MMTTRQFASAPVTLFVAGTPEPPPCLPARRPPRRLDAGSVTAALARTATRQWRPPAPEERQPPRRAAEFHLVELYQPYAGTVLRTALRAVEPGAGPDVLWEREATGPDGLDGVLAELGRSLAHGPRVRAVLVGRPGAARRLFVGMAAGPPARTLGVLEELRSALSHPPAPVTVPTSALQRELLRDATGGAEHGGRHVEQLSWNWHGPLDTDRFTAAWQSVFDHELVLRAAFDWPEDAHDDPWIVLHDRAVPEVTRHPSGAPGWEELLDADRRRGFDLRRPALLRATLVDTGPSDEGPVTRVLLTYHHAMLDGWSVRLLLQSFYRAYLTGGTLPGGERRPDLRDHARWLGTQDTGPARQFWSTRPAAAVVVPAGHIAHGRGSGRARRRLTPYEAVRLRGWAAAWGAGESSALQAAWALLLYRAAQEPDPRVAPRAVRVGFAVTLSGRGIPLDGIDRLPGALRAPLPITVRVHPSTTVPQLLAALRDGVLDLSSYEWVSPGQAHRWNGTPPGRRPQSLVVLEHLPLAPHHPRLDTGLAAHGIHVDTPTPAGTFTSYPITLTAHYDATGGLVLTTVHDRALLADRDATELLSQSAHLLRSFPDLPSGLATTELLRTTLAGHPAPHPGGPSDPAPSAPTGPTGPLETVHLDVLRRATRPGAGWVLLLPPPGTPDARFPATARTWPGPQALAVLRPVHDDAPPAAYRPLLAPLLESRAPVALVATTGNGLIACEIARLGPAATAPLVVLATTDTDLAALAAVLART